MVAKVSPKENTSRKIATHGKLEPKRLAKFSSKNVCFLAALAKLENGNVQPMLARQLAALGEIHISPHSMVANLTSKVFAVTCCQRENYQAVKASRSAFKMFFVVRTALRAQNRWRFICWEANQNR